MEFDDPEEQGHFRDVVTGFVEYTKSCEMEIARRQNALSCVGIPGLPAQSGGARSLVPELSSRASALRACVKTNQQVLQNLVEPYMAHVAQHRKDKRIQPHVLYSPPQR